MPKAVKTRNANTWTEAGYWSRIRSGLRRMFRFTWKPAALALERSKRKYQGPNPRQKFEYQCADCQNWFCRKEVEVDHIVPCGSLNCAADLAGFLERLHAERTEDFQVLCKDCHKKKTAEEREARALAA